MSFTKCMDVLNHLIKKKITKIIALYDLDGNPILSSGKNEMELEDEKLVGGFYTSITTFAAMKNFASSIKLESENGDVHIIKKSDHFIGALCWNKKLKLTLRDSEPILDEFLDYMEQQLVSHDFQQMPEY